MRLRKRRNVTWREAFAVMLPLAGLAVVATWIFDQPEQSAVLGAILVLYGVGVGVIARRNA